MKQALALLAGAFVAVASTAKTVSVNVEANVARDITDAEVAKVADGDALCKTGKGELAVRRGMSARLAAVDVQGGTLRFIDAFHRNGLAAMWSFDDPEDMGADSSPAHSFPLATDPASADLPTLVEDGVSGRALHFGSVSKTKGAKLIRAPAASPKGVVPGGTSAFTFSFWMRPTAGACGRGPNFFHVGTGGANYTNVYWNQNDFFVGSVMDSFTQPFQALCFYCGGGWTRDGEKGRTNLVAMAVFEEKGYLLDGRWHQVVCTYANRRMRIYVDGALRDERTRASAFSVASNPAITIGVWSATDGNHKYAGDLDEIQWCAGEWTPSEVKAEYDAGRPIRDGTPRPCAAVEGAAVSVAVGATLSLEGSAPWRFSTVTGAGSVRLRGGSTLSVGTYTNFTGDLSGLGTPVFAFDGTATAPQIVSAAAVKLPPRGKVVFPPGTDASRRFLLAEGPSFALPTNMTGWTFEPADAKRRVAFQAESKRLYVSLAQPDLAQLRSAGQVAFANVGTARPRFMETGWTKNHDGTGWEYADAYNGKFTLAEKTAYRIDGTVRVTDAGLGKVRAVWRFTPTADIASLASLNVSLNLPGSEYYGGRGVMKGTEKKIPAAFSGTAFQWTVRDPGEVTMFDVRGRERFTLSNITSPTSVLIQDNRNWDQETISIRMSAAVSSLTAGKTYEIGFDLATPTGCALTPGGYDIVQPGADYVRMKKPFGWIEPGSALDFSALRGTDAPAGRHGRVVRRGAHFEFADLPGVPQRFYGVNVVQDAVTPDKASCARFAANLARIGYNAVRLHHHERPVCDTNDLSQTTLDPVAMDRFDALVAALVENGIYLTTDVYVSRCPSYRSIGIDKDGMMTMGDAKTLLQVHDGMYGNLVKFTRAFFGHVNPYTGRSLAREPALIGLSLVNEPSNYMKPSEYVQIDAWRTAWERWLAAKKRTDPKTYGNVTTTAPSSYAAAAQGPAFMQFLRETEMDFAARMRTLLRDELGCQAPLASLNNCFVAGEITVGGAHSTAIANPAFETLARAEAYDFTIYNSYWDHPSFLDKKYSVPIKQAHQNPLTTAAVGFSGHMRYRHIDMPFGVTEFNNCAPMDYREVGGLMVGAMAALQDWDALWRFAWCHGRSGVENPEGKGYSWFDVSGDPANLAAERALVPLFLRRDLPPLRRTYAVPLKPSDYAGLTSNLALTAGSLDYRWAGWYAKLGFAVTNALPAVDRAAASYAAAIGHTRASVMADLGLAYDADGKMPIAGDGRVEVDSAAGRIVVNAGRTVGGFAPDGMFTAGPLTVDLCGEQAAVWATALDGEDVAGSRRILLTHLTDVQASGTQFADSAREVTLALGAQPFLVKTGRAEVALALIGHGARVYALEVDGTRRREVPTAVDGDGTVRFTADVAADPANATFLYEIVQKPRGAVLFVR